jgi:hypothetical protein
MRISFDESLKIVGVGMVPWPRLGPETWLKNYAIASLYNWDVPFEESTIHLRYLKEGGPRPTEMPRLNTSTLLAQKDFIDLLETAFKEYDILTYKPSFVPSALSHRKFLSGDPRYSYMLENKVNIRLNFGNSVKFPRYRIVKRPDLLSTEIGYLKAKYGFDKMVIQDEKLSGGKGTFIINDINDYYDALNYLGGDDPSRRIVISEAVDNAKEFSLQCCVTRYGVFTGPLQRQIISNPQLNLIADGIEKFGGGVIDQSDQHTDIHNTASKMARGIGEELERLGYKGVFGVDFLVNDKNEVYLIEVNARLTGMTHLLTSLYKNENSIPFYLLHILELGRYPYKIKDSSYSFPGSGSLLIVHSQSNKTNVIKNQPRSGTYRLVNGSLLRLSDNIELAKLQRGEFIIEAYNPTGHHTPKGGRIANLLFKESVIDKNTQVLYNTATEVIKAVRDKIQLETVRPNEQQSK